MKKAVFLFMFSMVTLIGSTFYANKQINNEGCQLSGKLVENSNNEVIDNALVTVSENGKVIAQTTVKEDGSFSFDKLPNRLLSLSIENVAYTTVNKTINLVNTSKFNFGNISIDSHITLLEEMIIFIKR